jgi:SAM-dependent methyltransferase
MIAPVLDACCGSRMFWFDKESPLAIFQDCRRGVQTLCDGRVLVVEPDVLADARKMPYPDNWFAHVVLDPPHLVNVGEQSYTFAKYGRLSRDFKTDLRQIFAECFRVLRPEGTLCFKWCAEQIKLGEVLPLAEPYKPLYGQKKGKGTFWLQFIKV